MTQVRTHSLLHYAIPHPRPERRYKQFDTPTYSGKMTSHAANRIRKKVDLLCQLSPEKMVWNPIAKKFQPFRLSFVTLTISTKSIVDPREGYKLLFAPFLRAMRSQGHVSYIWKGELQQRGQPHWHLTCNAWLHMNWVRDTWNNLQSKAGLLDDYFAEHGHRNAPSTEIKSVRNLKRIDLYLAKYISKKDSNGTWSGKVWGCSDNLRTGQQFTFSTSFLDEEAIRAEVEAGRAAQKRFDTFTVTSHPRPKTLLNPNRQLELKRHLDNLA